MKKAADLEIASAWAALATEAKNTRNCALTSCIGRLGTLLGITEIVPVGTRMPFLPMIHHDFFRVGLKRGDSIVCRTSGAVFEDTQVLIRADVIPDKTP